MATATIIITAKNAAKAAFDRAGKQATDLNKKMMRLASVMRGLFATGIVAMFARKLMDASTKTEELADAANKIKSRFSDAFDELADGFANIFIKAVPYINKIAAGFERVIRDLATGSAYLGARSAGSTHEEAWAIATNQVDEAEKMRDEKRAINDPENKRIAEQSAKDLADFEKDLQKELADMDEDFGKELARREKERLEKQKNDEIDRISEIDAEERKHADATYRRKRDLAEKLVEDQKRLAEQLASAAVTAKERFFDPESFEKTEKEDIKKQKRYESALSKARRGIKGSHITRAVDAYNAQVAADRASQQAKDMEAKAAAMEQRQTDALERIDISTEKALKALEANLKPGEV